MKWNYLETDDTPFWKLFEDLKMKYTDSNTLFNGNVSLVENKK